MKEQVIKTFSFPPLFLYIILSLLLLLSLPYFPSPLRPSSSLTPPQFPGPYPQVVLPKGDGYLSEETSSAFVFDKEDIFILERDQTSCVYR